MTKNIIFIIAALCSLQARADVQPTERDTVHRTYRYDDTELLQPLQPLYLDGVVVPARETAIGLSVSPEVRQPFSARRSVAKTCSGG